MALAEGHDAVADRSALRVLAIEDNPGDAVLVREMLSDADPTGFTLVHADRLSEGIAELLQARADCVLLDLSLPDADGLEALAQVRTVALDVPIIVLSGRNDERIAVRAVQEGAQDYLIKGQVDARLLGRAINYAIERKRVEVELAHQALHDQLTGLPNRALFLDRLGQALARLGRHGTSVGVLFLDLDRFKVVNDSLGHDAGDRLLIQVAERLADVLRLGDTAARFGGDEFVVLCEDITGERQAIAVAERIAEALATPFLLEGDEVFMRTSVGIAIAARMGHRPEALVRDADAAMYRAKERGGGSFEVFDDDMRERAVRRLATENALHRALDRGEFELHFQPQYRLATGAVCGVEALVRWNHPQRGIVAPAEFIASAEETGLVIELGAWVFGEACRRSVLWPGVKMAVNVSARQCAHPDFVPAIAAVLAATGADPGRICVEVTETAVTDDDSAALDVLRRLKELGVSLAIDDFGTGYSSLLALQRFPFDIVKIDRTFVSAVEATDQNDAIVAAIITLAHALELEAIAEGVETLTQADRVRTLGCDIAQGFHFARPEPVSVLDELLGANS